MLLGEIVHCKVCGTAIMGMANLGRDGVCASCTSHICRQYMTVLSDEEWEAAIKQTRAPKDDLREFMVEFRRTLLQMVHYIDKRWNSST